MIYIYIYIPLPITPVSRVARSHFVRDPTPKPTKLFFPYKMVGRLKSLQMVGADTASQMKDKLRDKTKTKAGRQDQGQERDKTSEADTASQPR